MVAFKGPNAILGLYKCNYSLTRGKEFGTAAGYKQGARLDKTRWRARLDLHMLHIESNFPYFLGCFYFSITVYIQCHSVLFSDEQHSG